MLSILPKKPKPSTATTVQLGGVAPVVSRTNPPTGPTPPPLNPTSPLRPLVENPSPKPSPETVEISAVAQVERFIESNDDCCVQDTGSGSYSEGTVANGITFGQAVAVNDDGEMVRGSSSLLGHMGRIAGLAMNSAAIGNGIKVRTSGSVENGSWNWSPGPVFVGIDGALTQSPPQFPSARFSQQVGTALSSTKVVVDLQIAIKLG